MFYTNTNLFYQSVIQLYFCNCMLFIQKNWYLSYELRLYSLHKNSACGGPDRPHGIVIKKKKVFSHKPRKFPNRRPSIQKEFSPSLTSVSVQVFCAFLKRGVITAYTIFPSEFKTFTAVTLNLQDWKTERYKEIIKSRTVSSMLSLFHKLTS